MCPSSASRARDRSMSSPPGLLLEPIGTGSRDLRRVAVVAPREHDLDRRLAARPLGLLAQQPHVGLHLVLAAGRLRDPDLAAGDADDANGPPEGPCAAPLVRSAATPVAAREWRDASR